MNAQIASVCEPLLVLLFYWQFYNCFIAGYQGIFCSFQDRHSSLLFVATLSEVFLVTALLAFVRVPGFMCVTL